MKCKCMLTCRWFIIPWWSLMWPKDYLNMCHIFYYIFSVKFLQSIWIRPQKIFQTKILVVTSLVNHHPVNIIISIDIAMSDSATCKCFVTIACHIYTFNCYLSFAGVLYHAIVREQLALAVQHTLVFWNDNVYWMVTDKWCHNKNLGLEKKFVGVSKYSEEN